MKYSTDYKSQTLLRQLINDYQISKRFGMFFFPFFSYYSSSEKTQWQYVVYIKFKKNLLNKIGRQRKNLINVKIEQVYLK